MERRRFLSLGAVYLTLTLPSIKNTPTAFSSSLVEDSAAAIEIGVPTSFGRDYGYYQVWRFQGTALQRWKEDGRIEPALIGDAISRAGLIPEQTRLETPQLDNTQPHEDLLNACQASGLSWRGRASHYSEAGCVGCRADRLMANGQRFDENAFTLAFMRFPLNTKVLVTNLDNGLSARALVTDTGGFESMGRIADLSFGLANHLRVTTDQSLIEVTKLNC